MFKQKQLRLAIVFALTSGSLVLAAPALAESKHHDGEHRQHGAHEHGAASMTIALDGQQLIVELNSPAMNILGFEHDAETPEHKAVAADTLKILKRPEGVISLDGGNCTVSSSDVEMPQLKKAEGKDKHKAKDKHHDDKHDEHLDDHHDKHDDEKHDKHNDDKEDRHSDIKATYNFKCAKPEQLKSLTVQVFENFPNFESVDTQWIINGRQGSKSLKAGSTSISVE